MQVLMFDDLFDRLSLGCFSLLSIVTCHPSFVMLKEGKEKMASLSQ